MTRQALFCFVLLLAVPAAAQESAMPADASATAAGQEQPPGPIGSGANPENFDLARKKVVDCEGEKFLFSWGAGARPTKVTLCSKKDATADELVRMLDDAAAKLQGTVSIAEDRRIAIVQQIRAKIAEIKSTAAATSAPVEVVRAPAYLPQAATSLPPPTPAPAPFAAAPVFTRKPMPVATPSLLAAKPRLTFECYTPGDIGSGGPCTTFGRDTRLTVKAGEPLAAGIALRFRRYGETRAEVALSAMRKGQSVRLVVPRQLCGGVVEAEVEIQVTRSGNPVDTRGPYLLRC